MFYFLKYVYIQKKICEWKLSQTFEREKKLEKKIIKSVHTSPNLPNLSLPVFPL